MKNKTIMLICTFFLGCGRVGEDQKFFANKDPGQIFSQSATQESFTQNSTQEFFTQEENTIQESFTQETNISIQKPSVDMLFVIDNSGSMQQEQKALADNFSTFIDNFLEKNIDFKIGIITTDGEAVTNTDFSSWTPKKMPKDWWSWRNRKLSIDPFHTSTLHCKTNIVQEGELSFYGSTKR